MDKTRSLTKTRSKKEQRNSREYVDGNKICSRKFQDLLNLAEQKILDMEDRTFEIIQSEEGK
jgi:hypothetical protein